MRYSKTEAKLEKGFKAVACKALSCLTRSLLSFLIDSIRSFRTQYGLFYRGIGVVDYRHFPLHPWSLQTPSQSRVLHFRTSLFYIRYQRSSRFSANDIVHLPLGLMTMVGVTLYVSITTEESVKIDQDLPVMYCSYGYSFLCAVFSFVLQELTGVLTVYWFIYRFRALVRKQEKLRERTRQLMGNCLSMTTALPLNLATFNAMPNNNSNNATSKSPDNRSNHYSTPNNVRYQYVVGDTVNSLNTHQQIAQQRRRLPFDRSPPAPPPPPSMFPISMGPHRGENISSSPSSFPPRSPTLPYGDYCRVLIRAEDMELLSQMVQSKSQAHILANSRPSTPGPTMTLNVKALANSHNHRSIIDNPPHRRASRKGVKRTTSV